MKHPQVEPGQGIINRRMKEGNAALNRPAHICRGMGWTVYKGYGMLYYYLENNDENSLKMKEQNCVLGKMPAGKLQGHGKW